MQRLWIPGRPPGLNDLIEASGSTTPLSGGRRYTRYNEIKQSWSERVVLLARSQRFLRVEEGYFTYLIYEPNRRRDPSNIVAGAVKIIEDAMKLAGLIPDDGWKTVLGFVGYWVVDSRIEGTSLFVDAEHVLSKEGAVANDMNERAVGHGKKVR